MGAMSESPREPEDDEILGRLPRTRPGRRSPRRDEAAEKRARSAASSRASAERATRAAAGREPGGEPKAPQEPPAAQPGVGDALAGVARTGVAVASGTVGLGLQGRGRRARRASRHDRSPLSSVDEAERAEEAPSAGPGPQTESRELFDRMGRGVWVYLRAFWHRAYREGITGLAGMVAYNLMLALFPFALLCPLHLRPDHSEPDDRGQRDRRPRAPLPRRRHDHPREHARQHPRQLDDDRRPRRGRRNLDRNLVLGRDGHLVLPHLPRRVPRLGRAEALRADDARRDSPVLRLDRDHPGARDRLHLDRRRPPVRARRAELPAQPDPARRRAAPHLRDRLA